MANPEDLGRYRLKRLLGRGVRGEVWEAEDDGDKVAVKIMHAADDDLIAARIHFAREARLATVVRHPHVVTIRDAGEAAGTSFLVMDMVEGRSLRALIDEPPAEITLDDKLRWLREIGGALEAVHRAGIAHRDLKPENVVIRGDGGACVVDLGICKWMRFERSAQIHPEDALDLESTLAAEDAPDEPPEYVPPETTTDQVYDELGDQYAWGVLAYELLTGRRPSAGAPRLTEDKTLPRGVAEVIDRARESPRGARWESMADLVARLAEEIEAASTASSPPKPSRAPSRPPPEGRIPLVVVLIAIAFVALIAVMLLRLR